jgi:hypothetical protein
VEELLDRTRDINDDVYRNIVSLRKSEDLFDDLSEGDETLSNVAIQAEMRVKRDIEPGLVHRGFHYSTAIGYPFETEPFMASRYGTGLYGVWYGSLELETTLHETAHHMIKTESGIEGNNEPISRDRAVYQVMCNALLIDLVGKETIHPRLVSDDYTFTQHIGARLQREGHPGLLAPSARLAGGQNAVIFNPDVLSNARLTCYFTYTFDPSARSVAIEREPGVVEHTVTFE